MVAVRWLLVLPAAVGAYVLAVLLVPLGWVLTAGSLAQALPLGGVPALDALARELDILILSGLQSFAAGAFFVAAGTWTAPARRGAVSKALLVAVIALAAAALAWSAVTGWGLYGPLQTALASVATAVGGAYGREMIRTEEA